MSEELFIKASASLYNIIHEKNEAEQIEILFGFANLFIKHNPVLANSYIKTMSKIFTHNV